MLKSALAKLLTVKALIIVAAAGSTGIVLAATDGALPGPWSGTPAGPPSVQRSTSTPTLTSVPVPVPVCRCRCRRRRPTSVIPTGQPSDAGRSADAGSAPAPSMTGLCRAYTAQVDKSPGKALDNPAFGALVTAAGGAANVPAYCADVVADKPHGKPSDLPTTSPGNTGDPPGSGPATPPGRPQAPVSPALGAVPAVPPSGARTPSPGG